MFNIDYDKITEMLLPVALRQPRTKAWLKALSKPLKQLLNTFQSYRLAAWQTLTHTGQVMYLDHLLNLVFNTNPALPGAIYIADSTDLRPDDYFFTTADGIPYYMNNNGEDADTNWLNNKAEFLNTKDFVIKIPTSLSVSEPQIRQTVDTYRTAGKRYAIEYYEINPTP